VTVFLVIKETLWKNTSGIKSFFKNIRPISWRGVETSDLPKLSPWREVRTSICHFPNTTNYFKPRTRYSCIRFPHPPQPEKIPFGKVVLHSETLYSEVEKLYTHCKVNISDSIYYLSHHRVYMYLLQPISTLSCDRIFSHKGNVMEKHIGYKVVFQKY
jgi:hypothetical protein